MEKILEILRPHRRRHEQGPDSEFRLGMRRDKHLGVRATWYSAEQQEREERNSDVTTAPSRGDARNIRAKSQSDHGIRT